MARRPLDPEAVADGAGRPSVAELVALVHAVNPTDRGLPDAERDRRYALKARLQGRLVRDWAEHLSFTLDEETGVLAIDVRGHARDAAHVPLSALDPEARSIVRQRLDLPDEAPTTLPERSPPVSRAAGDALARGRRALDEWDYEAARAAFTEAYAARGDEASAHALVSLLVEHLGADEDALAVPIAKPSARTAPLLALAAARLGDEARASALLASCPARSGAAARLVLAERALRGTDLAAAASHLAAARDEDPANGELLRLEEALRRRRDEGRAPVEQALADAVGTGDEARIRSAAEALLQVAPRHPGARRALAAIDDARRRADAAALLAEAERLDAEGSVERARHALHRATELDPELSTRAHDLRARLEARAAEEALEAAVAAAHAGDWSRYLALSADGRAAARDRVADPRLERLEALRTAGARDPVAALRAWARGEEALAAGRLSEASAAVAGLAALSPLRPFVEALDRARDAAEREATRQRARAALASAERGEGDLLARAGGIDRDLLDEDLRSALDAAVAAAGRAARAREEAARFEADLAANPFAARAAAERRLADDPADATWRARLVRAEAVIGEAVSSVRAEPWSTDLADAPLPQAQFSPDVCLEPDGRFAWLADARAWWLFVRRIEVATGRPVALWVVRTTHPFTLPRVAKSGNRLLVCGGGGRVLALELGTDGSIARALGYAGSWQGVLASAEYVDAGGDARRVLIKDVGRMPAVFFADWEVGRTGVSVVRGAVSSLLALDGAGRLGRIDHDGKTGYLTWHQPDQPPRRLGWAARMEGAAAHPSGDGFAFVGNFLAVDDRATTVALLDPASRNPLRRRWIGPSTAHTHPLASSRRSGLLYLLHHPTATPVIVALDGALEERWRVAVPGLAHLLTDPTGEHVVAAIATRTGGTLVPLGTEPPALPDGLTPLPEHVPAPILADLDALGPTASAPRAVADPTAPSIRAAWARARAEAAPAARFAALGDAEVWRAAELHTTALRAAAAMDWADGPWAQRLHAVAAAVDLWERRTGNGEGRVVRDLPGAPDEGALAAQVRAARAWAEEAWRAGPR